MATTAELRGRVTLDRTAWNAGMRRLRRGVQGFASDMKQSFRQAGAGAQRLVAGLAAVTGALAGVGVSQNFKLEEMQVQFETLLGSTKAAREELERLVQFSASTPFSLNDVTTAARQLQTFGGAALNNADTLKLVGDAAAGTSQPFQDVAFWTGRMYAAIQGGQPFGEARQRLMEMSILTPQAAAEMKALAESGADAAEVFSVFQRDAGRLGGGMERLSRTGKGLTSTLKDNLLLALADVTSGLADVARSVLPDAIEWLQRLRESGDLRKWGQQVGQTLYRVVAAFRMLSDGAKKQLAAMAGAAGLLLVAWKSGLLAPLLTLTAKAVGGLVSMLSPQVLLAGLIATLGFLSGRRVGLALENSFDLSGLLLKAGAWFKHVGTLVVGNLMANLETVRKWRSLVDQVLSGEISGEGFKRAMAKVTKEAVEGADERAKAALKGFKTDFQLIDSVRDEPEEWREAWKNAGDQVADELAGTYDALRDKLSGLFGVALGPLEEFLAKLKSVEDAEIPELPEYNAEGAERTADAVERLGKGRVTSLRRAGPQDIPKNALGAQLFTAVGRRLAGVGGVVGSAGGLAPGALAAPAVGAPQAGQLAGARGAAGEQAGALQKLVQLAGERNKLLTDLKNRELGSWF